MKQGFVYILTNKPNGTLYIGVTSDLVKRIYEHKNKLLKGFSAKYNLDKLVYYEVYDDIAEATNKERQLKNWHRDWKINLIQKENPNWIDLSKSIGYNITADAEFISASHEIPKQVRDLRYIEEKK